MSITLPHRIENGHGETLIFKEIIKEPDGDKVIVEGYCAPNAGPTMHVHYKQDEGITVVKGKIGCQLFGQNPVYYSEGEEVVFLRGTPHRFWNAGEDELMISGWIKPANSIIFFLSTLYGAFKKSKTTRPDAFDAAYLMVRYKHEYDLPELPSFVKNIIMPITYAVGTLLGKYKNFTDAPKPLK
ncbi:MAG: cupin domain-containing protein [Armatimonadetes bacterium]|nr:cupin domain-containing protein [Armatimonadota bacterium]